MLSVSENSYFGRGSVLETNAQKESNIVGKAYLQCKARVLVSAIYGTEIGGGRSYYGNPSSLCLLHTVFCSH